MTRFIMVALMTCEAAAVQPDWTVSLPAGIEWSTTVGDGDAAGVLLATPAGELHLIDLQTGKSRLAAPIAAGRGVRLAAGPERDGIAYCFDRHAAYAIQLAAPAGLKWQYGRAAGTNEGLSDDPECIAGWMHAEATASGLLLVDNGGRVVLLAETDGQPRWDLSLGPLPVSRLHVRDNRAVVLWKRGGAVRAAFLSLDKTPPKPNIRDLGDTWPVWSSLVPEGLLTVAGRQLALTPFSEDSEKGRSGCPQHYVSAWWTPSPSSPFAAMWPAWCLQPTR